MKLNTKFLSLAAMVMGFVVLTAFAPQDQKKGASWSIPAKYKSMKNTTKADDAELLKIGKGLYAKHCKACHGNNGQGDGPKAKQLKTFPGDFLSAEFKAYGDGEIYYMSFIGRDEMPNFEKKLTTEEDRWAVVNYIRSMKK